jgi:hypothetical protein
VGSGDGGVALEIEVEGGAERQMGRHREESTCVRTPYLVGRRETMSPRIGEGWIF